MNASPKNININFYEIPYNESGQLNSQLEPVLCHDSINSEINGQDNIVYNQKAEKFKLIFIGNQGVGKSSLIFRLINKCFNPNIKPTNGYEVSLLDLEIKNRAYILQLWDSSGDEKYEKILNAFYKDVSALILVFDLNDPKSFDELEFWLNQAKEFISNPCIPFLLGIKSDLLKVVDSELVKDFWYNEKLEYFECSSLNGEGCDDLLGFLIGRIENNRQSKMYLSTEARMTYGYRNSRNSNIPTPTVKKEYLYNSEMYFAKKNTFMETSKADPIKRKRACTLI